MKVFLFISYYNNPSRREEFLYCIKKNLKNQFIDKIYVFCEDELPIDNQKLVKIDSGEFKNPSFGKIFSFFEKDCINIVANTDIYFDSSIRLVKNLKSNEVFCLSRREISWGLNFQIFKRRVGNSQDAWIFNGQVYEDVVDKSDFSLGKPGCDNHLAWLLNNSSYKLYNPAYDIKAVHVHKSQSRSYTAKDRVIGEYLNIVPDSYFGYSFSMRINYYLNIIYEKCFQ